MLCFSDPPVKSANVFPSSTVRRIALLFPQLLGYKIPTASEAVISVLCLTTHQSSVGSRAGKSPLLPESCEALISINFPILLLSVTQPLLTDHH